MAAVEIIVDTPKGKRWLNYEDWAAEQAFQRHLMLGKPAKDFKYETTRKKKGDSEERLSCSDEGS